MKKKAKWPLSSRLTDEETKMTVAVVMEKLIAHPGTKHVRDHAHDAAEEFAREFPAMPEDLAVAHAKMHAKRYGPDMGLFFRGLFLGEVDAARARRRA